MAALLTPESLSRHLGSALGLGVAAVIAISYVAGGLATALLVGAGLALAGAIFLLYSSLIGLTGQNELTLEEALTLVAPSHEEEQKRAVLRALKDLEYEHSVGKIGEEDYAELAARYREEARRLLNAVEEAQAERLARAERAAQRYLAEHARPTPAQATKGSDDSGASKRDGVSERDGDDEHDGDDERDGDDDPSANDAEAEGGDASDDDPDANASDDDRDDRPGANGDDERDDGEDDGDGDVPAQAAQPAAAPKRGHTSKKRFGRSRRKR